MLSFRKLAKTCNFCPDECLQKNIRDQIVGGLPNGDAVETLLRERDLLLATAVELTSVELKRLQGSSEGRSQVRTPTLASSDSRMTVAAQRSRVGHVFAIVHFHRPIGPTCPSEGLHRMMHPVNPHPGGRCPV